MTTSTFSNMSDQEFVNSLFDKRQFSPVVDDLCRRLENSLGKCPVCDADINQARLSLE